MINYSIAMMGNPSDKEVPKKAYGVAQYTEKMTLSEFSEHISSHGSTYDAEDVEAILFCHKNYIKTFGRFYFYAYICGMFLSNKQKL